MFYLVHMGGAGFVPGQMSGGGMFGSNQGSHQVCFQVILNLVILSNNKTEISNLLRMTRF